MSEASQTTADTTPACHAGRTVPNMVTSESIAALYSPPDPAQKDASTEAATDKSDKPAPKEDKPNDGKKKGFQDRISEVVAQRKAAETKAEDAERRAAELEAKLKVMEARPTPSEEKARPQRFAFADDEQFIDALAEWKADQAISKREAAQREAQEKEATAQVMAAFQKRQTKVMAEIEDYADVIGQSKVQLPTHITDAIYEGKAGPLLAYYFAKNPDEAARFSRMRPATALMELSDLGKELLASDEPASVTNSKPVEVSKAPRPITPVRETSAVLSGTPKDFESYRAKRQQELAAKRR